MQDDLFSRPSPSSPEPLASRMRPRNLDEYIGQDAIVGPGRLLRRAIQADQLSSLILYGPPGTGKTTLAKVIANTTRSSFLSLNAVLSGVKEVRESIEEAKKQRDFYGRRTILFVDEVHRWNKSQQDALLPWVENGTVILVGATTENPFFEVNRALVSRSRIFRLEPLGEQELFAVARQALADPDRGYGKYRVEIDPDALEHIVRVANGDARSLLNALELAVETTPSRFPPPPDETIRIDLAVAEESIQKKAVLYDKEGDYHFDVISAFIKSIRGSDPDAALYWLARMLGAGEDPRFIFRRLLISAGEDIGMADPQGMVVAEAAAAAFDRVGLPEGAYQLIHATLYLATAPKSNSALGFFDAVRAVEEERDRDVPNHLRDASRDKQGFGHGEGYRYPHAYREHWVAQNYLPREVQGRLFYRPAATGYEAAIRDKVQSRREAQLAAMGDEESREAFSFSPGDRERDRWALRSESGRSEMLQATRERTFAPLKIARHDRILVAADSGGGLLLREAFRIVPEGGVWTLEPDPEVRGLLAAWAEGLPETERPILIPRALRNPGSGSGSVPASVPPGLEGIRFRAAVGRNLLSAESDREALLRVLSGMLEPAGEISLAETCPSLGQRLTELLPAGVLPDGLLARASAAEAERYGVSAPGTDSPDIHTDPRFGWDGETLRTSALSAGFAEARFEAQEFSSQRTVREADLERWLDPGRPEGYGGTLLLSLGAEEFRRFTAVLQRELSGRTVSWKQTVVFLYGKTGG